MFDYFPWLSVILFLPLGGGLAAGFLGRRPRLCRSISLGAALANLFLVSCLFFLDLKIISNPAGRWLLVEDAPWIQRFGVRYSLGLDGISLTLVWLTSFLIALGVLVSWREIDRKVGVYHFLLLAMETTVIGVFLATDLFLFYLFWELQMIPIFLLIGIYGHENRIYATIKFFLYSLSGSLLMLIALIILYVLHGMQSGHYTFALGELMKTSIPFSMEIWLYAAFLLAFAIKIPAVPLHTWLPDAHTQASTVGSVILAGLLLKTGTYALVRFGFPIFPIASKTLVPLLLIVGLIGLFYASWIALAQKDIKRLVAYSSIGHMGLVVVGIAVWNMLTLSGAFLQMISHGITTSALFIMVGMLTARVNTREIIHYGGLWKKMPVFSGFFLLFAMASLGLPGLNNFVGEFLILLGSLKALPWVGWVGFSGLVFTLIYIVWLVQRTLYGETRDKEIGERDLPDITVREALILVPLAAVVFFIGLHPQSILDLYQAPLQSLMQQVGR